MRDDTAEANPIVTYSLAIPPGELVRVPADQIPAYWQIKAPYATPRTIFGFHDAADAFRYFLGLELATS